MSDNVGIFSMWYLVPVTYFDRSHGLSQLGSAGHADRLPVSYCLALETIVTMQLVDPIKYC